MNSNQTDQFDADMAVCRDIDARRQAAYVRAMVAFHDDKVSAIVLAHQLLNDPKKPIHQAVYWDLSTVVTEFSDPVFGSQDRQLLVGLQERYGENLRVEVAVVGERRYFRVWVFHLDFLNRLFLPKTVQDKASVFLWQLEMFVVYELGSYYSLYSRLGQYPAVSDIVAASLPPVRVDGGVSYLPVVQATPSETHKFSKFPTFGAPITGVDPSLLLTEGVVIDCGKIGRYRVWFDWETTIDSNQTPTCKIVPTDDPVTEESNCDIGLQLRGRGRSHDWTGIVPIRRATKCLFVLELPSEKDLLCVHAIVQDGKIRAVCTNR